LFLANLPLEEGLACSASASEATNTFEGCSSMACAALPDVAERDTRLGRWAKGLLGRAHQNVAVVAVANKLVRTVLRRGQRFDHQLVPLTA